MLLCDIIIPFFFKENSSSDPISIFKAASKKKNLDAHKNKNFDFITLEGVMPTRLFSLCETARDADKNFIHREWKFRCDKERRRKEIWEEKKLFSSLKKSSSSFSSCVPHTPTTYMKRMIFMWNVWDDFLFFLSRFEQGITKSRVRRANYQASK